MRNKETTATTRVIISENVLNPTLVGTLNEKLWLDKKIASALVSLTLSLSFSPSFRPNY